MIHPCTNLKQGFANVLFCNPNPFDLKYIWSRFEIQIVFQQLNTTFEVLFCSCFIAVGFILKM